MRDDKMIYINLQKRHINLDFQMQHM